jgi:hypothetical protein
VDESGFHSAIDPTTAGMVAGATNNPDMTLPILKFEPVAGEYADGGGTMQT